MIYPINEPPAPTATPIQWTYHLNKHFCFIDQQPKNAKDRLLPQERAHYKPQSYIVLTIITL